MGFGSCCNSVDFEEEEDEEESVYSGFSERSDSGKSSDSQKDLHFFTKRSNSCQSVTSVVEEETPYDDENIEKVLEYDECFMSMRDDCFILSPKILSPPRFLEAMCPESTYDDNIGNDGLWWFP